ncbi:ABC transporter [Seiridium cupressi]
MTIIPSALFIVASICRLPFLVRRRSVVHTLLQQATKLCAIAIWLIMQLILLILVGTSSFRVSSLFVASSTVQLTTGMFMIVLSYYEHSRSPRPSLLLNTYLAITLLFDIAEARTFWLASATKAETLYTSVLTAAIAVKATVLVLEMVHKRVRWSSAESHSPEETSSIFELGVYSWLTSLFMDGYRSILQIENLYPLDDAMKGNTLNSRFQRHLDYIQLRQAKYGLGRVLCRTLAVQLLLPVFPRLLNVGFKFCQPLFIQRLLYYLSTDEVETFPEAAYGFIGASILIFTGIAITKSLSDYLHHRSLQMIRGCLVSAIYTKATEVPASSGQESESITLMSSDLERIRAGFLRWQDMWTSIIEKAWLSSVQRRVGLTASVIANMKNLKISGLTKPVGEVVQGLRTEELKTGSRFRLLILLSIIIGSSPLTLSPIFTFAFARKILDPARMFTSISYLTLLSNPLVNLFEAFPPFLAAVACLDRIQVYLAAESRNDTRKSLNRSLDPLREKSPDQIDISSNDITDNSAVVISNGSFGWSPEQTTLRGINVGIPKLSITVICGPIASGKSTLCKAILAEIPHSNGTISLGRDIHQSRIAYCEQTPFLSNDSIKNNIVGFTPFEEKRYVEVVSVTMLDADLQEMPSGDRTYVGSNGITLSGGQRQRLALAPDSMPTPGTAACASIDNLALQKIDRSTLRCRIISIPQDVVFLPDGSSYRENLDPFKVTGATDCQHVLEIVGLWNFIQNRGGLEADMSPGTFSHGQRQLFSLARAILRRRLRLRICDTRGMAECGILLLDEVSSSVDRETETEMQAIIMVEFKHYTVIAVSHHLDMVLDFDKVVVMDRGSIVEVGDPKTLSQDSSTRFGELWKAGGKSNSFQ